MGEHPFSWPPQALYGLVVLGADVAYYLVVRALIQANGPKSEVQRLFGHYPKLTLSIVLNIIALIVGKMVTNRCPDYDCFSHVILSENKEILK